MALRRIGFDVIEGRDLEKRAMEEKIFRRKLDKAASRCSSSELGKVVPYGVYDVGANQGG